MKQITPCLYIGRTTTITKNSLQKEDITHVINLSLEETHHDTESIPLMNGDLNTQSEIRNAIKSVHQHIENNERTLVMSETGTSRSVTIITSALALKHETDFETAFEMVKQSYKEADPNDDIVKQVKEFVNSKAHN